MVRSLLAVSVAAILVALPAAGVAGQQFKNHGQCVSACVQDLGVASNGACTAMCKAGTYGQDEGGAPAGGTLPPGSLCQPANDQCAPPAACQPLMPGFPMYLCM